MSTAERTAPRPALAGTPTTEAGRPRSPAAPLIRQAFRGIRTLTVVFAYVFAIYAYVQPPGYRSAYPSRADRLGFAATFARNKGLRLLYGLPRGVETVEGYVAWRVGGVLAIAAALFGMLVAVRITRAEEEAGRTELVLAGVAARSTLATAGLAAVLGAAVALGIAETAGLVAGGLALGASAFQGLATASIVPVCAGVGALAAQLANTRRGALQLGGVAIAVLFVLRVLADTVDRLGALRWLTPLGWAELLRPFAGPEPWVLVLPVGAGALLLLVAARVATRRDIGTGLLPAHDVAEPRYRLLGSVTAQGLRSQLGVLATWTVAIGAFGFLFGAIAKSISTADVSKDLQRQLDKLGAGSITTPAGYLSFLFVFVVVVVCAFACTQVGAARQEETEGRLDTILAQPVGRRRWLAGRLGLALASAAAVALVCGLLAWCGARVAGAHLSLPSLLGAGANALPASTFFLGLGALAYALAPRASSGVTYGVLTAAFLWQLVGSLLGAPRWLLDATPFAHVAAVPQQPFDALAAVVMVAIGVALAGVALVAVDRRDLLGT